MLDLGENLIQNTDEAFSFGQEKDWEEYRSIYEGEWDGSEMWGDN